MKRKKILQGLISFLTAALMFFAFGCAAGKESGGENISGSDSMRESQSSEVDKGAPLAYFSFDSLDSNGNFILDTRFNDIDSSLEERLKAITGVIESGLFIGYDIKVIVAE